MEKKWLAGRSGIIYGRIILRMYSYPRYFYSIVPLGVAGRNVKLYV